MTRRFDESEDKLVFGATPTEQAKEYIYFKQVARILVGFLVKQNNTSSDGAMLEGIRIDQLF